MYITNLCYFVCSDSDQICLVQVFKIVHYVVMKLVHHASNCLSFSGGFNDPSYYDNFNVNIYFTMYI